MSPHSRDFSLQMRLLFPTQVWGFSCRLQGWKVEKPDSKERRELAKPPAKAMKSGGGEGQGDSGRVGDAERRDVMNLAAAFPCSGVPACRPPGQGSSRSPAAPRSPARSSRRLPGATAQRVTARTVRRAPQQFFIAVRRDRGAARRVVWDRGCPGAPTGSEDKPWRPLGGLGAGAECRGCCLWREVRHRLIRHCRETEMCSGRAGPPPGQPPARSLRQRWSTAAVSPEVETLTV
ncbi:uncharacterized protein LOC135305127 isoform X1 [Passer domesticus]|uniref:uncharacterized protein LOC135305127 isoform X1 n=1 Tax=Passer domesticus TaxID=48849 RepID=UPI0030FEC79C